MRTFRLLLVSAVLVVVGILTGCSQQPATKTAAEQPKPAAETKKQPVLYTAQECLKRVEGQAHLWALDARPIHIESDLTSESSGKDGKSAVWRFMFVSGQRGAMHAFMCSGSLDPSAPAFGLSEGGDMPLPQAGAAFDSFLLKVDSDKAFEVSLGHGGESLLKKNPDQPVTYIVEMAHGQTTPAWFVIYGKDLKSNKGLGVVNATTGAFLRGK